MRWCLRVASTAALCLLLWLVFLLELGLATLKLDALHPIVGMLDSGASLPCHLFWLALEGGIVRGVFCHVGRARLFHALERLETCWRKRRGHGVDEGMCVYEVTWSNQRGMGGDDAIGIDVQKAPTASAAFLAAAMLRAEGGVIMTSGDDMR